MSTSNRKQFTSENEAVYRALAKTGAGFRETPEVAQAKAAFIQALNATEGETMGARLERGCAAAGALVAAFVTTGERYGMKTADMMQDEIADQMLNRVAFWTREYLIIHNKATRNVTKR